MNLAQSSGSEISAGLLNEVSADVLGTAIGVTGAFVAAALDPWIFVEARTILGGPAPPTVEVAIAEARERHMVDKAANAERLYRIVQASTDRCNWIQTVAGA